MSWGSQFFMLRPRCRGMCAVRPSLLLASACERRWPSSTKNVASRKNPMERELKVNVIKKQIRGCALSSSAGLGLKLSSGQIRIAALGFALWFRTASQMQLHRCHLRAGDPSFQLGVKGVTQIWSTLWKNAFAIINIPTILEPSELFRDDGKCPDGTPVTPFHNRRSRYLVHWDATSIDRFAPSCCLTASSEETVVACRPKIGKSKVQVLYEQIKTSHDSSTLVIETFGGLGSATLVYWMERLFIYASSVTSPFNVTLPSDF